MSGSSHTPVLLLPPPAATILLYAADGLAVWKQHLGPSGFPHMPARTIWVPMFRELINSDEGMRTLHALSRSGMQAWHSPPDHFKSLKSAFRDITLRALLIATLEDYADTGPVRIILPPAPSRPQPAPPPPRPEPVQHDPSTKPRTPPRRPPPRSSAATSTPG